MIQQKNNRIGEVDFSEVSGYVRLSGFIVPSMVGVVPSMVGVVSCMVGLVPSMVGVVPSMVGVVPCMGWYLESVVQ